MMSQVQREIRNFHHIEAKDTCWDRELKYSQHMYNKDCVMNILHYPQNSH